MAADGQHGQGEGQARLQHRMPSRAPPCPVEVLAEGMATCNLKTPDCVLLGGNEMPADHKAIETLHITYLHWVLKTQGVVLRAHQAGKCSHLTAGTGDVVEGPTHCPCPGCHLIPGSEDQQHPLHQHPA